MLCDLVQITKYQWRWQAYSEKFTECSHHITVPECYSPSVKTRTEDILHYKSKPKKNIQRSDPNVRTSNIEIWQTYGLNCHFIVFVNVWHDLYIFLKVHWSNQSTKIEHCYCASLFSPTYSIISIHVSSSSTLSYWHKYLTRVATLFSYHVTQYLIVLI